ncbi:hypothetical protein ColTof4_14312 [Colletotrichum tofieldiae]|nr:hypothetical protein ColTof4_14312 [Colletotrichum tofieldiae]
MPASRSTASSILPPILAAIPNSLHVRRTLASRLGFDPGTAMVFLHHPAGFVLLINHMIHVRQVLPVLMTLALDRMPALLISGYGPRSLQLKKINLEPDRKPPHLAMELHRLACRSSVFIAEALEAGSVLVDG